MRRLTQEEQTLLIKNREFILRHLQELQADLEDLSDEQLIECRYIMLKRVNACLSAVFETDEDNEG